MKDRVIWSPSKKMCVRASMIGAIYITESGTTGEVGATICDLNLKSALQVFFGTNRMDEAKKWTEDAAFIIEQAQADPISNVKKRLIRPDEEKND